MRKIALITGATSGIGRATALLLANNNYDLIICGRRFERLEELKKEIAGKVRILSLSFDLTQNDQVQKALKEIPQEWQQVSVLINNAGNAHGLSPIHEGDLQDWEMMIDINIKGLLYISKIVIPWIIKKGGGHVINLGSIAGKEVYPNGNVYCASKFAVDALSSGMRIDLNKYNIKVTSINPGMVNTEFSEIRFKGDKEKAENVYKGVQPLAAEDIADIILFVLQRPSHVAISDLTVFPTAQASATIVNRRN